MARTVPTDIVDALRLPRSEHSLGTLPTAVPRRDVLHTDPVTDLDTLNSILVQFDLPPVPYELEARIAALEVLLAREPFTEIKMDLQGVRSKLDLMEDARRTEEVCDKREVELANIRAEMVEEYTDKSTEELKQILQMRRKKAETLKRLSEYRQIVAEMAGGRKRAYHLLASSSFLREATKGVYYRMMAEELLSSSREEWRRVVLMVLRNRICSVEMLGAQLGLDRVMLLKVIYNLCSKNILCYNRLQDTVSLASNV